eukprot:gene13429-biopygen13469
MLPRLERWGEAGQQLIGQVFGVAGLLQAGQQDDEFVTAQAGDGVDVSQLVLEANGDVLEQQVANRVAEAVVDVFETVEVEEQHGALAAGFLLVVEGGLQAAFKQGAVGQAGQRVVVGLVIEARLGVLEAGDVGKHGDEVGDRLLAVAHGADGQPAGVQLAVLAPVGDLALPVAVGRQLVPHGRVEGAVVQARGKQARGLAEGLGFAVAGDLAEGAVHGADILPGVGDQYAFGRALEHGGGLLQFFLHQLAFGDVPGDGQHAVVVADGQRAAGDFTQANFAVAAADVADKVADKSIPLQPLQHVFAFVQVDPDPEVQG